MYCTLSIALYLLHRFMFSQYNAIFLNHYQMKLETFIVFKTMNIDKCSKKWFVQVHVIISFLSQYQSFLSLWFREYASVHPVHKCMRMQCDCDWSETVFAGLQAPLSLADVPVNMVCRTQLNVNSWTYPNPTEWRTGLTRVHTHSLLRHWARRQCHVKRQKCKKYRR